MSELSDIYQKGVKLIDGQGHTKLRSAINAIIYLKSVADKKFYKVSR